MCVCVCVCDVLCLLLLLLFFFLLFFFKGTLDYLFFAPPDSQNDISSVSDVVRSVRPLPTKEELDKNVALPSVDWPSDHLAVAGILQFGEEEKNSFNESRVGEG